MRRSWWDLIDGVLGYVVSRDPWHLKLNLFIFGRNPIVLGVYEKVLREDLIDGVLGYVVSRDPWPLKLNLFIFGRNPIVLVVYEKVLMRPNRWCTRLRGVTWPLTSKTQLVYFWSEPYSVGCLWEGLERRPNQRCNWGRGVTWPQASRTKLLYYWSKPYRVWCVWKCLDDTWCMVFSLTWFHVTPDP